jgi:radical SAM superfamily enzyme YgiQ (UPF0313 family)
MAKVLLIQANYDIDSNGEVPWMPIALVEIATFINENGQEAKILDRNIYPDNNKLLSILKDFNPDIVGMTCYTSQIIKDVKQIARLTKENSKALVIVGGIHATLEPKSLLDFGYIDYIVRGEGEYPLLEICQLIDKSKANKANILKIENVNYNKLRPLINLRDMPIPNYDLLEVKKYPFASFYTSRGCPGKCTFCYNQSKTLRIYDTKKTIAMITGVIEKYKIKEFNILDDNFANQSMRTTEICDALSKYNSIFHCFLRTDQVTDKVMSELKKAGCWIIQFGFESGSQRILDFLNKGTTVQQNELAIKQCKKYGIFVDGSFMIGLPTENNTELNETISFIKKNKPDISNIKIYKPYPSTELYNYCVKNKLIQVPSDLDEWKDFCELKEGNVNVSNIPTEVLIKTLKDFDRTRSSSIAIRKSLFLLKSGHINYLLFKARNILTNKLTVNKNAKK